MPKRILYSGFKWEKHDEQSGYQHIVPEGSDYVDGGKLFFGGAPFRSYRNRINLFLVDLITCYRGLRYDCVFIFYPEHTVYISPFVLSLAGVKVIYGVHIDENYWFGPTSSPIMKLKRWQTKFVSHFILLSNVQAGPFRGRFQDRVTFIPHGIWNRRKILPKDKASSKILVIGDSYRDYDLLIKTCDLFRVSLPDVTFHLVGIDKKKMLIQKIPENITIHSRLESDEYYGLMAESELIFLPLTYAAANNALLEGLSLGVPVVCNNMEGVTDYLPSGDYVVTSPEELQILYSKRLAMTKAERVAEQCALRKYSEENFDWEVIHKRVEALCETL